MPPTADHDGPSFPDLFIVSSYDELADFSAGARNSVSLAVLAVLAMSATAQAQ